MRKTRLFEAPAVRLEFPQVPLFYRDVEVPVLEVAVDGVGLNPLADNETNDEKKVFCVSTKCVMVSFSSTYATVTLITVFQIYIS